MANKEFCIECGHKNVFEVSRPKFCSGCGASFNTSLGSSKLKNEDESVLDNDFHLEIDKKALKESISVEVYNNKTSLDDLWKSPAPREERNFRQGSKDPEGEAILKQTIKECSKVKEPVEINE